MSGIRVACQGIRLNGRQVGPLTLEPQTKRRRQRTAARTVQPPDRCLHSIYPRLLQPDDDRPDAPLVAVTSHGLWQRLYGGAPDVVGGLLRIDGQAFEIVGVAPQGWTALLRLHP